LIDKRVLELVEQAKQEIKAELVKYLNGEMTVLVKHVQKDEGIFGIFYNRVSELLSSQSNNQVSIVCQPQEQTFDDGSKQYCIKVKIE